MKSPIKKPYFFDTKEGIDHFVKVAVEENPKKLDPKELKEIKDLGNDMKKSAYESHARSVKQSGNLNPSSFPKDPLQRGKLLEMGKLEADLKANNINYNPKYNAKKPPVKKRNYWDATVELNKGNKGELKLPPLTAEEKLRAKQPSDWEIIYGSMTPFEKGQWNSSERKKGYDGKTGSKLQTKPQKEIFKPVDLDVISELTPVIAQPEKSVEEIIKEKADERLKREQDFYDRENGIDGIVNLLRPE